MSKPLVLIDGSSYFFRAFHALPSLMTSKGQHTGAIYGVVNMVKKLIKDYEPENIAIIFDAKGKTFRNDLYQDYKANRSAMPTELVSQFQHLIDCLHAFGIPVVIVEGVEADDVIGTLVQDALAQNLTVLISTSDKDMAQLVNENVKLINTMSQQILDVEGVKQKFGVTPEQIIDYLTLIGDASDNIPGVLKCGPKTAAKWISDYKTLDNIVEHALEITGKVGENLRQTLPELPLYKQLITIKKDVKLPVTIADLKPKAKDNSKLIEIVTELEFKGWLKELLTENNTDVKKFETKDFHFEIINTAVLLDRLLTLLEYSEIFSLNIETTDLAGINAEIVGIAFAFENSVPCYLPLLQKDNGFQLNSQEVLNLLKPFFENKKIAKIGHNLKYTYIVLKQYGIDLQGILFDTMIESYVLNPTASKHDLDSLALVYLGYKPTALSEIAGKIKSFDEIDVNQAALLATENAHINFQIHNVIYPKIKNSLTNVLHEIDLPLIEVLSEMECLGVLIDKDILLKHGERLKIEITSLTEEAYNLAGKKFNLNSPKQLQEILFNEQKLPVLIKTATGQPSTAEAALQELAFNYRLPQIILEHRSLSKLVSTYIDALPKRINPKTKRVHTSYNQAVTATGRLSSTEPNLQNIPIRSKEGRLIRTAFIAPADNLVVAADYSQIELRIMAHISKDESLVHAFQKGWDIHSATASEIFAVDINEVSQEQRRQAKVVNFGLIYGMSAFGLATRLGLSKERAQEYIEKYFERFPKVREYMENTKIQARENGFVETIFGRRLYLPEITSANRIRQMAAQRAAINAPMQGSAADIIKKAMIAFNQLKDKQSAKMIMQVHDELVFEVHKDNIPNAIQIIKNLMENTVVLTVPLEVSIGVGENWDLAH